MYPCRLLVVVGVDVALCDARVLRVAEILSEKGAGETLAHERVQDLR